MDSGEGFRGPNFNVQENIALCRAYIAISEDPIIGRNQTATTMWARIVGKFEEFHPPTNQYQKRTAKSLKSRWTHINQKCTKFAEYLAQAYMRPRSGANAPDIVDDARRLFAIVTGSNFSLDHCWSILQHGKKWRKITELHEGQSASEEVTPISSENDAPLNMDDGSPYESVPETQSEPSSSRPIGREKAKKIKKGKDVATEIVEQGRDMKKLMKEYKESSDWATEYSIMSTKTSTIETPARRAWMIDQQNKIVAKMSSRSLNFDDDSYHPQMP